MTQRGLSLAVLLAATLAGHAVAQLTFTNLTACDLGPAAAAISSQPACSLTNVQTSIALAPNQAVMVPFNNFYRAGFQSIAYQGFSSIITASNPTGQAQTVFFMFGVCDSQASAASCAVGWRDRAVSSTALPTVCSTNCALGTLADAITAPISSLANWKNPQYSTGLTVNNIALTASITSALNSVFNLISRSDASYSSFGSDFVFFMGSLSTLSINVQLTLTSVTTTQSAWPASSPSPAPGPSNGPSSSSSSALSSGAIAGIVIGAVVGVLLIAALAFFLVKRGGSKKTEVAPTPMPDEPAPKAATEV